MSEAFLGYYAYAATVLLLLLGLFGMLMKRNLVKKLIAMNILQTAVILFYIIISTKWGSTIPILEHAAHGQEHAINPEHFANPLPHALMLTAIVVSVATTGVSLALLILIKRRFGTLEENEILERSSS
ncbi:MAG: cation:proton antiporter subunit C [Candidatus Eisenbacteria bacterium]|uniref:Cation:proton antiporter subunit C n=1 Tax=Eiseniibacteriota bacterium TaxID=2212470 RepID=A0A948RTY8_UNCEI|nr:cation:proton antiporter subunit C [Candidatus Eisenbacteria bacterium]MBU1947467.1 cation:proton antiporter subunit C [Candidatus Eisenbacteria bacterium]MBU2690840.1 cation:proton antiporter subunit C [Candidatus Eisenbacteria bacterium]